MDPGDDEIIRDGLVVTVEHIRLQCHPVTREQRIEFVKRCARRTRTLKDREVRDRELGLQRRDIERLQELRLQQLADARDLVAL